MTELENLLMLTMAGVVTATTLVVLIVQFVRLYGKRGRAGDR